jgi:hypothetical protein
MCPWKYNLDFPYSWDAVSILFSQVKGFYAPRVTFKGFERYVKVPVSGLAINASALEAVVIETNGILK